MNKITVISSLYGGYDEVQPVPEQTIDARWILVTDQPCDAPGWEVIIEPRPDVHPRLAAKVAKCLPWQYTSSQINVWMDAACTLLKQDSLEFILSRAYGPISQIVHPWRNDILDEAEASAGMLKYQGRSVLEQAKHYVNEGHPRNFGLWATGLIVYDFHESWSQREQLDEFGAHWLTEQVRWTYQDQLSEAPTLRKFGLRPADLGFSLHGSGWLEWRSHAHEG